MQPQLKFEASGLTAAQYIALARCFEQITMGAVPDAQPQPQTADPFSAPVPQAQPGVVQKPQTDQQPAGGSTVPPGAVRDAHGVPYNPALHSVTTGPTGGRNQDGSWKMKKNINRDLYEQWKIQHRSVANAPGPVAGATPAPSPDQLNQQFGAPPVAQPQPANGADPFTAQPGVAFGVQPQPAPPVDYATFVAKCNELMSKGRLGTHEVARVKQAVGTADEKMINNDPATRALAYQELLKIEAEALQPA